MFAPDGSLRLYYKDSRAPVETDVDTMQRTSGTKQASSYDGGASWTDPTPVLELIGPWGTEGPELLVVNKTLRMYFDCTFQVNALL